MTEPQQFLIYQSEDGSTRIDVMLEAETLWLNQKQLTELFGKAKGTTSVDYDARQPLTQQFFATVQNKVHYAIHGQTAAELITSRADSRLPNMGLTTWEGARIRPGFGGTMISPWIFVMQLTGLDGAQGRNRTADTRIFSPPDII